MGADGCWRMSQGPGGRKGGPGRSVTRARRLYPPCFAPHARVRIEMNASARTGNVTTIQEISAEPRPAMHEIDTFGLTHRGKVRSTNNDHFLIASFHRNLRVHFTSIPGGIGAPGDGVARFPLPRRRWRGRPVRAPVTAARSPSRRWPSTSCTRPRSARKSC